MPPLPFPSSEQPANSSAGSPQWTAAVESQEKQAQSTFDGVSSPDSSPPPLTLSSPESESSSASTVPNSATRINEPLDPPLYRLTEASLRTQSTRFNDFHLHQQQSLFRRHDSEPLNTQALERQQQHQKLRHRHEIPVALQSNKVHVQRRSIFTKECKQQAGRHPHHHQEEHKNDDPSSSDNHHLSISKNRHRHPTPEEIKLLISPPPDRLLQQPHFVDLNHPVASSIGVSVPPLISQHAAASISSETVSTSTPHQTNIDASSNNNNPQQSSAENLHLFSPENMPQPLKRFYHNGTRTTQMGVYPLLTCPPAPILRESSYKGITDTMSDNVSDTSNSDESDSMTPEERALGSFNLTDTIRQHKKKLARTASAEAASPTTVNALPFAPKLSVSSPSTDTPAGNNTVLSRRASRSPSTSSSSPRVQFDPRVTVTEFHDGPRYWFSHKELEHMKDQAISTVRKYLIQHPDLISTYNEPRLDPITGTFRRKALFSIPVLNHAYEPPSTLPGQDMREAIGISSHQVRYQDHHARLHQVLTSADIHFKNVLIACRNPLVLDLLKRSLKGLFPFATIHTCSTGEDAIQAINEVPMDLVLAEIRLEKPSYPQATTPNRARYAYQQQFGEGSRHYHGHSNSLNACIFQEEFRRLHLRTPSTPASSTVNAGSNNDYSANTSNQSNGVSGSIHSYPQPEVSTGIQLFDHLTQLETPGRFIEAHRPACVMIGLTTLQRSEADTPEFEHHGASWIWTLPPPPMDASLKQKLAVFLMQKRAAFKYRDSSDDS